MAPMPEILSSLYPWIKALHVMSIIAWMAALFYLPRLFVYHAERGAPGSETDALLRVMEDKLYRIIMTPAMLASWGFGLLLVLTPGVVDWGAAWAWVKTAGVLAMTGFHLWCRARLKDFADGRNVLAGRRYRMMNELPTLLMAAIVLAVIVRF